MKKLLIALALCSAASAQAETWLTDTQNSCQVLDLFTEGKAEVSWSGKCDKDGKATGRGTLIWSSEGTVDSTYTGQLVAGAAHGKGKLVWTDGDHYDGDWVKGQRTGKGSYVWANGDRYQGQWQSAKMHGKGVYSWPNGSKYEGQFENNDFHGFGKMILVKGDEAIETWGDSGKWQGGRYVVSGQFANDELQFTCATPAACAKELARQQQ